jgi:hypothetical protein
VLGFMVFGLGRIFFASIPLGLRMERFLRLPIGIGLEMFLDPAEIPRRKIIFSPFKGGWGI